MIKAGELRHLVELQEDRRTGDESSRGEVAENWGTRANVWAKIEQLTANERLTFNQQYAEATHRITTRWSSKCNPTPSWRIKATINRETVYFHIGSVENDGFTNEAWVFICGQQVAVRDSDT